MISFIKIIIKNALLINNEINNSLNNNINREYINMTLIKKRFVLFQEVLYNKDVS